jgi:hypothetical protein
MAQRTGKPAMSEGTLVHGGRGTGAFLSTFLRSACCNTPIFQVRVEEMCVQLNSCCGCKAILASPEDWDMELISGDAFPIPNEILENLTFVDLETGPQAFRTITVY